MESLNKALWRPWMTSNTTYSDVAGNLNEARNTSHDVGLPKTQAIASSIYTATGSVYSSPTIDLSLFNRPDQSNQCRNVSEVVNTSYNVRLPETRSQNSNVSLSPSSLCSGNVYSSPTSDPSLFNWPSHVSLSPKRDTSDIQCPTPIKRQRSSVFQTFLHSTSKYSSKRSCVDLSATANNNLSPTSTTSVDLTAVTSNNLRLTSTTRADLIVTNSSNSLTTAGLTTTATTSLSPARENTDLTATNTDNLSPTSTTGADLTKTCTDNFSGTSTTRAELTATNSNNSLPSADLAFDLSHFTSWLETKLQQISEVNELSQFLEADSLNGPNEFNMKISLPKDLPIPNAEWIYCDETGLELALNPNTSSLFEHLYSTSSKLDSTVQMLLPETGREYEISLKGMVMTDVQTREKVALFRRTWRPEIIQQPTIRSGPDEFPPQWSAQESDIQLVSLDTTTAEFAAIQAIFLGTLPSRSILQIERVQNKKLYIRYAFQKALLLDKYSGNEQRLNEKMLFHGTKRTLPRKIWQSEDGFDLRYSRRGMWGFGTYFAENASYSDNYAHKKKGEFNEMFLANVLTGNSIEMNSNRITRGMNRPPVCIEATATKPEVLYDSVTGFAGGSQIYIVYKLDMAYPSYLVRYI